MSKDSETKISKDILSTFYDAMSDTLTLEDCATGVDITFQHEGRIFTVNTSVGTGFRMRSIEAYYKLLERKVINAVTDEGEQNV